MQEIAAQAKGFRMITSLSCRCHYFKRYTTSRHMRPTRGTEGVQQPVNKRDELKTTGQATFKSLISSPSSRNSVLQKSLYYHSVFCSSPMKMSPSFYYHRNSVFAFHTCTSETRIYFNVFESLPTFLHVTI